MVARYCRGAGDRRGRPKQLQRQSRHRRDEPLDFSGGFPPKLAISGEDSLGERVQRALPDAKVVKAFNTIGNQYFVDPSFREGKPTMLIAGDDEAAKAPSATSWPTSAGPDAVDIGGIEGARELEAICIA